MEAFCVLLALCMGNSPVTGEFPSQRLVTQSFDTYFDLRLNRRLSKQSCSWWFEMPLCSLWHYCNQSGTKPTLVTKIWPPNLVTICAWLPKLVANVSSNFHHLVNKRKPPCIGGMELVSLSCNRVFISAESVGRGWCKIAIATKWYQFHTTDKCGFLFMPWITDQYTFVRYTKLVNGIGTAVTKVIAFSIMTT